MNVNYVDLDGEQVSRAEYCRRLGYNYGTIKGIMCRHKVSFEEAIEEFKKPKNERKWAKRVSKNVRLRNIWYSMMDRCYNPKHPSYLRYGGRKPKPIQVCDRWHDYFNFEDDMYDEYIEHVEKYGEKDTSIDRFPNKLGDYAPSNTRWATCKEQSNNLISNHMITDELNCAQFAEKYNIPLGVVRYRHNMGWSIEDIINTPVKKSKLINPLTGETTLQMAERLGISTQTIQRRLKEGYTWEEIEEKPFKLIVAPTGETLGELSKKLNIPLHVLHNRYFRGWEWDRIINTPLNRHEFIVSPTGESLKEISEKTNIPIKTLYARYKKGWDWDKIINTPTSNGKSIERIIAPTGETTKELAERLGLTVRAIQTRYENGWTWDEIMNTPLRKHRKSN